MDDGVTRRSFITALAATALAPAILSAAASQPAPTSAPATGPAVRRPNIILLMSDDQGWADAGYMGHKILKTPNLDAMAGNGLRFGRFYAASPVCSPTRASCLTGRFPNRYGILFANADADENAPSRHCLPKSELTIAEACKSAGYATAFFGKWHIGDFDGPKKSAPSDHGFDEYFATIRKVPSVNPDAYWFNGQRVKEPLLGDDSRIMMDRALPFIRKSVADAKPFLAVIWFHAPHVPVLATPEYKAMYPDCDDHEKNYFGALTAMDDQIGRLRAELRALGVADDTMLWFTSDNGPEVRGEGSAGGLNGKKRSLHEGGVRVPGLLEWPAVIRAPRATEFVASTMDYYPTTLDVLGLAPDPKQPQPIDGVSLLPLIEGRQLERPGLLMFDRNDQRGSHRLAAVGQRYKLMSDLGASENPDALYDLLHDPGETRDIAADHPEIVAPMRKELGRFFRSYKDAVAKRHAEIQAEIDAQNKAKHGTDDDRIVP